MTGCSMPTLGEETLATVEVGIAGRKLLKKVKTKKSPRKGTDQKKLKVGKPFSRNKKLEKPSLKGPRIPTKLFSRLLQISKPTGSLATFHPDTSSNSRKRKLEGRSEVKKKKNCKEDPDIAQLDFSSLQLTSIQPQKRESSAEQNPTNQDQDFHVSSPLSILSINTHVSGSTALEQIGKYQTVIENSSTADKKGKGRMYWLKGKADEWYKNPTFIRYYQFIGESSNKTYLNGKSVSGIQSQLRELGARKNIGFHRVEEAQRSKSNTVNIYYNDLENKIGSMLTELICLIRLRGTKRIAKIISIIENQQGDFVGLTMVRCQMTLEEYLRVKREITSQQIFKLIKDMTAAVKVLHNQGITHGSLSEVNFMVNEAEGRLLKDYSSRPRVTLVNYKNARFVGSDWGTMSTDEQCLMQKIRAFSDWEHTGSSKNEPTAEDIKSLGMLIWYTLSLEKPWKNLNLGHFADYDQRLRAEIQETFPGAKWRELLVGCLLIGDTGRWTINKLSKFISSKRNRNQLIMELEKKLK